MTDIYVANHTIYLDGAKIEPGVELPTGVDAEVIAHLQENDAVRLAEPKVEVAKLDAKNTTKAAAKAADSEV